VYELRSGRRAEEWHSGTGILWPFDSSFARGDVADLLDDASEGAVAEVYGILLADRESRNKTPV